MDVWITVLIFFIAIFAGFVGSLVGGGALILIPVLSFLGVPLPVAIASHKLGSIGVTAGALPKYWKEKKVMWRYVIPFSLIAIAGAYVGAHFVLLLDEVLLSRIVGVILLLLLPMLLLRKNVGLKRRETLWWQKWIGFVLAFPLAILSGFFGGGKPLFIYTLTGFFGFTFLESNATSMIPLFLLSLSASVVFLLGGVIDFILTITIFSGMVVGAFWGAKTALKKGDAWLKVILVLMLGFSGVKLLFWPS